MTFPVPWVYLIPFPTILRPNFPIARLKKWQIPCPKKALLAPFQRKTIDFSAKYIKFNKMKNKIFLDALSKSDARWDGKQNFFFIWPNMQ